MNKRVAISCEGNTEILLFRIRMWADFSNSAAVTGRTEPNRRAASCTVADAGAAVCLCCTHLSYLQRSSTIMSEERKWIKRYSPIELLMCLHVEQFRINTLLLGEVSVYKTGCRSSLGRMLHLTVRAMLRGTVNSMWLDIWINYVGYRSQTTMQGRSQPKSGTLSLVLLLILLIVFYIIFTFENFLQKFLYHKFMVI